MSLNSNGNENDPQMAHVGHHSAAVHGAGMDVANDEDNLMAELSGNELIEFRKLEKKMNAPMNVINEAALLEIEARNTDWSPIFQKFMLDANKSACDFIVHIQRIEKDNVRLIAQVRYLKKLNKN